MRPERRSQQSIDVVACFQCRSHRNKPDGRRCRTGNGPHNFIAPIGFDQFQPAGLQFGRTKREPRHQCRYIELSLGRRERTLYVDREFRPGGN